MNGRDKKKEERLTSLGIEIISLQFSIGTTHNLIGIKIKIDIFLDEEFYDFIFVRQSAFQRINKIEMGKAEREKNRNFDFDVKFPLESFRVVST